MARVIRAREGGARIGLADLVHGEIGDPPGAVGGAVERLVVDDRELAVGREVHVELDRIGAGLQPEPEGLHRVLGRLGGRPAMRDDDRHAAIPSTSASAARSSLSASPSGTPRRIQTPISRRTKSEAIAIW